MWITNSLSLALALRQCYISGVHWKQCAENAAHNRFKQILPRIGSAGKTSDLNYGYAAIVTAHRQTHPASTRVFQSLLFQAILKILHPAV
jgi:hypothetical protein